MSMWMWQKKLQLVKGEVYGALQSLFMVRAFVSQNPNAPKEIK